MASGFLETIVNELSFGSGGVSPPTITASSQGANNWGSGIVLDTNSTIELPTGMVHWSHLEIMLLDLNQDNAVDKTCQVFLSWDEDGDDICAGPSSAATMVAGRNDPDRYMVVFDLDMKPTLPPDGTANRVYLWFQTTNFIDTTPPVIRARLHWNIILKG